MIFIRGATPDYESLDNVSTFLFSAFFIWINLPIPKVKGHRTNAGAELLEIQKSPKSNTLPYTQETNDSLSKMESRCQRGLPTPQPPIWITHCIVHLFKHQSSSCSMSGMNACLSRVQILLNNACTNNERMALHREKLFMAGNLDTESLLKCIQFYSSKAISNRNKSFIHRSY